MASSARARLIAGIGVLAAAAALGVVSGGRAGSGPATNSDYKFFAQPAILSVGAEGIAWGVFTAASGTGSATHVVMSITLPTGVSPVATYTSSGCTDGNNDGTYECSIGTVNAGQTVKRYVGFTSSVPGDHTFSSFVTWDKGADGPGGGSLNRLPATDSYTSPVTVVASGHANRAGTCTGTASTPPVSSANQVSTAISNGVPAVALPCRWGFVGENAPSGLSKSEISFFAFPRTALGSPVEWVVTIFKSPVPFKDLKVFFKADYDGVTNTSFAGATELSACTGPDNTLGVDPPQDACLKLLEKVGGGARATILAKGTGADPGSGFG